MAFAVGAACGAVVVSAVAYGLVKRKRGLFDAAESQLLIFMCSPRSKRNGSTAQIHNARLL